MVDNSREPPSWRRIEDAAVAIDPVFLHSPLVTSTALDEVLGCHLVAKVETLNPIGSFKGRGTSWFVRAGLAHDAPATLVASSAGNFGQGLAYAIRGTDLALIIYAATNANPDKIAAMRRLGATVVLEGVDFDASKKAAIQFAAEVGAYLVVDGDEATIAEGAGTIALEMIEELRAPLDSFVVSLGNGALATGIGAWVRHASSQTTMVAVAAAGAPSMALSWHQRKVVETSTVGTIADGIAVRVPVPYALDTMVGTVDDVLAVNDEVLISAMRLVHRYFGLVVEPSGVAGIAAVLADPARWADQTVGTVLCGANIDRSRARDWLFDAGSTRTPTP